MPQTGNDGPCTNVSSQVSKLEVSAGNYSTDYQYTYDANGNIATVTTGGKTTRYAYDTHNQLIREDNQAAGKTWTWTYDAGGNILNKKEYSYTTGTLGSPTSTKTYTYGDTQWGDKLTAYNGTAITYDQVGNPLNDGTWTYTWKKGRQLATMTKNSGEEWEYTYDADGLRTQRTNGVITYKYYYSNGVLKSMNVGTAKLVFDYDANGLPLTLTYKVGDGDEMVYCFVTNLQGDVMAIMDGGGNTIVAYTYDAWGRVLTTTGTLATSLGQINPLRYRSYVYDQETGLYYLQSRYYNPEWGRFINADVLVEAQDNLIGNNLFSYCFNNPINYIDISGLYPQPISEEDESYIEYFRNDDGSYSLYDSHRFGRDSVFHEQFIVATVSGPSCSVGGEGTSFGLGSISFDLVTGGWEWEYVDLSLFDYGHVDLALEYKDGHFRAGAYASIWSPSISFEVFGRDIEISVDIGSIGAYFEYKKGKKTTKVGAGIGFSITYG